MIGGNDLNKTFCILPWIHMHIWPDGTTYPCCLASNEYVLGNTNKHSFKEVWNSERMCQLRTNIVNDTPTQGCNRCYEHERNGPSSMRTNMNKDFEHLFDRTELTNKDGSLDDIHMAYLDIRFSNICNMKCRTCGPQLSSFWADDAVKLGQLSADAPKVLKIKNNVDDLWDTMVTWLDTVERIYFAGGEPLIMEEHYKILEYLIEHGKTDVQISYNTNLSRLTYKKKNVLDLWKQFPRVRVCASLDASGDRAELMRSGTTWSDIELNAYEIKKHDNIEFVLSPTVSIYNAEHITDLLADWMDKGLIGNKDFSINMLLVPEYLQVQVLPESKRNEIIAKVYLFQEKYNIRPDKLQAMINCLKQDKPELTAQFLEYNDKLDTIRDETLTQVFPELSSIKGI